MHKTSETLIVKKTFIKIIVNIILTLLFTNAQIKLTFTEEKREYKNNA